MKRLVADQALDILMLKDDFQQEGTQLVTLTLGQTFERLQERLDREWKCGEARDELPPLASSRTYQMVLQGPASFGIRL